MVDYRGLRFNNLHSERFRHLWLLVFWPLFSLFFGFAERGVRADYYIMYSRLDDLIPFCEYFLIPYLFWFVFLAGMLVYALLFDVPCFVRAMRFIIITYSFALLVYFVFPNAQELRPASFERDNMFTRIMADYYAFDTHTNVCPSLHVVGAVAAMLAGWHSVHFRKLPWKIAFFLIALSICMSTVLLKQHSILDVFAALVVCAAAYPLAFAGKWRLRRHTPLLAGKPGPEPEQG